MFPAARRRALESSSLGRRDTVKVVGMGFEFTAHWYGRRRAIRHSVANPRQVRPANCGDPASSTRNGHAWLLRASPVAVLVGKKVSRSAVEPRLTPAVRAELKNEHKKTSDQWQRNEETVYVKC